MALIVAGLLSLIALTIAHPTPIDWVQFKAVHDKNYGSLAEEYLRQQIFEENMKMIEEHNRRHKLGLESFSMEMNQFGDLTDEEFRHSILCVNMSTNKLGKPWSSTPALNGNDLPASVDWREQGAVTPVKNQKMCGSCWAFSTTGSLEGQVYKKEGKLVGLSEQNLVDCSGRYGNNGCNGGLMDNAFRYIIANGGIDTEEAYPYEAKDNKCRYNKDAVGAVVKSFVDIDSGNEDALAEAVANVGPIAVAIDASANSFRFYKSGVYYNAVCAAAGLNHAVLAVGYGTENGQEYWLVKNSWSTNWGDNGYIKMAKNRNNHCGIASYASYPVL